MKFDYNSPNDEIYWNGDSVIKSEYEQPCVVCHEYTHWYSLSFLGPVCSTECLDKLWEDFDRDYLKGHDDETSNSRK